MRELSGVTSAVSLPVSLLAAAAPRAVGEDGDAIGINQTDRRLQNQQDYAGRFCLRGCERGSAHACEIVCLSGFVCVFILERLVKPTLRLIGADFPRTLPRSLSVSPSVSQVFVTKCLVCLHFVPSGDTCGGRMHLVLF